MPTIKQVTCIECGAPVIKAGRPYSGKVQVQQYMCTNKECGRFRVRTTRVKTTGRA